jgi:putative restriction endonuclease
MGACQKESFVSLQELIAKFSNIRTFREEQVTAPNKPLLILYALGKLESENLKRLSFSLCEKSYGNLLKLYGRTSNPKPHPEHAFYRLKNDSGGSIWTFRDPNKVIVETSSRDATVLSLRDQSVEAGLSDEVLEAIDRDPKIIGKLAKHILAENFPESLHYEILDNVGLSSFASPGGSRPRDPSFRRNVLNAYGYQCAVCGFSLRLGDVSVALEAAHIMWHQAKGPDEVNNGLSLCCMHHNLFDRGAFTISEDYRINASSLVNSKGEDTVYAFNKEKINLPRDSECYPNTDFLRWHKSQIFLP